MGQQPRHPHSCRAVAEALELKVGDEVEIHVEGAREFAMRRKSSREDLLKRLRALRGRLTPISSSTGTRRMSGDPKFGSWL